MFSQWQPGLTMRRADLQTSHDRPGHVANGGCQMSHQLGRLTAELGSNRNGIELAVMGMLLEGCAEGRDEGGDDLSRRCLCSLESLLEYLRCGPPLTVGTLIVFCGFLKHAIGPCLQSACHQLGLLQSFG